jgi:uncharacterized protein YceH (UPF0502 family)
MPDLLSDVELRVLGVLIEKALSQPAGYPLTLNAIVLGANQKQNRDPVVAYEEANVAQALYKLQQKNLVQHAATAPGARANRFQHNVVEVYGWDRREQAIMAELMLRGRQTAGELRARASRMTPLESVEAVGAVLQGLMQADQPFVLELPREPGRAANRFRHVLARESAAASQALHVVATTPEPPRATTPEDPTSVPLGDRVAALECRVEELTRVVQQIQQKTGACADEQMGTGL